MLLDKIMSPPIVSGVTLLALKNIPEAKGPIPGFGSAQQKWIGIARPVQEYHRRVTHVGNVVIASTDIEAIMPGQYGAVAQFGI